MVALRVTKSSPPSPAGAREGGETHLPCRRHRRPGRQIDSRTRDPFPNRVVVAHLASVVVGRTSWRRRHAAGGSEGRLGGNRHSRKSAPGACARVWRADQLAPQEASVPGPTRKRARAVQRRLSSRLDSRFTTRSLPGPLRVESLSRVACSLIPWCFRGPVSGPYLPGGAFPLPHAACNLHS
jgi:hypothetical protein